MIFAVWGRDQRARSRVWKELLGQLGLPRSSRSTELGEIGVWGPAALQASASSTGADMVDAIEWGVAQPAMELRDASLSARSPSIEGRPTFVRAFAHDVWLLGTKLAPLAAISPRLSVDADGLAGQVAFIAAPRRMPLLGLQRIPSGEEWTFATSGAPTVHDTRAQAQPIRPHGGSLEDIREEFWERTRQSVRRATDGFQRVAVMAAGGLDSSALLAATLAEARGANAKEVQAITWHFGGRGDDRPYFAELTKDLGIEPVYLAPSVAAADVVSTMVAGGLPLTPLTVTLQTCALRRARERGAEVMLLGSGGDEVLAGVVEASLVGDAREGPFGLARALGRALRFKTPLHMPLSRRMGLIARPLLREFVPIALRQRRMRKQLTGWMPHLGPRALSLLDEVVAQKVRAAKAPRTPDERFLTFAGRGHFEEYAEHRSQIEGVGALPIRDPYMDDDIARFVASVPPEFLTHGDYHRGLFREALRGRIPERIRLRTDKAFFEEVVAALLAGPGVRERARALSHAKHSGALGIVDAAILRRHVAEALDGSMLEGYFRMSFLWSALVVEAFLEVAQ